MHTPFEVIECSTAKEFIETISPRGPLFGATPLHEEWIFRGHGLANSYALLPVALRPSTQEKLRSLLYLPEGPTIPAGSEQAQAVMEASVLVQFWNDLDRQGLVVPNNIPEVGIALNKVFDAMVKTMAGNKGLYEQWPPPEMLPLLALGQHHGLPTRLLDWSRSSFTAAYFAAEERAVPKLERQHFADSTEPACVWAIYSPVFRMRARSNARTVEVPRASNPNMHAQDGLFTIHNWTWAGVGAKPAKHRSLDDVLLDLSAGDGWHGAHPSIYRIEFPRDCSAEVLWYLAKEGVTGPRLFPGTDGVVKGILERPYQRRPR